MLLQVAPKRKKQVMSFLSARAITVALYLETANNIFQSIYFFLDDFSFISMEKSFLVL